MKLPSLSVLQTPRKMKQWLERMTGNWPLLLTASHRSYSRTVHLNTLRTGDTDLRLYITTVQDG
jgi:hypothetical protein